MAAMSETPSPPAQTTRPIELDEIDAPCEDLWLRPVGLLTGAAARAAVAHGVALPLAGGTTSFGLIELLAKQNGEYVATLVPLKRLELWSSQQDASRRARIEAQLKRLSEKRERWAGLALDRPLIMGIVNVTPDSFYAGSSGDTEKALTLARGMMETGADIIDIGAESTRPGATPVSEEEELARLAPVLKGLAAEKAVVSVDTRHARVMEMAHRWGARIINDIAALEGEGSLEAAARTGAAIVLMHMRGEPQTMQREPHYDLPSAEIAAYLAARIKACELAGIPRHRIVVDPGIGFGKTLAHNLEILARLALFQSLGCGVLVGLSRKSSIGRVSGGAAVEARLPGSLAGALQAVRQGAQILRVHDVAETKQALAVWQAIANGA
jgi:dihydropteroate synthase